MKKVNVSEGGLISYEEFFKSFQKSDAEVSGLTTCQILLYFRR